MGALGALLVHVGVIALFILVSFEVPQPDEEAGGVPVVMGNVEAAQGWDDPSLVDVDVLEEEVQPVAEAAPELPSEQDLLTQAEEETVVIKPKTEKPKEKPVKPKETVKPKKEAKPKEPMKKPEKTEAEKAAEAKRLAAEKAERERKAAEEAARKKVANAFGKGAKMEGNKGTSAAGAGTEGNPKGNSSSGSKNGLGGYGTFDLGGRSLGKGTRLPLPVYNVQEEGRVVVEITVNPAGQVVAAKISPKTNTVNPKLRKAAMDAARMARFEEIKGLTNQLGTITYYFNLK